MPATSSSSEEDGDGEGDGEGDGGEAVEASVASGIGLVCSCFGEASHR